MVSVLQSLRAVEPAFRNEIDAHAVSSVMEPIHIKHKLRHASEGWSDAKSCLVLILPLARIGKQCHAVSSFGAQISVRSTVTCARLVSRVRPPADYT